jgi:hypothetical protein
MQNPEILAEMAKKSQNHVHLHYSWESITCKTLQLYEGLLASSQPENKSLVV